MCCRSARWDAASPGSTRGTHASLLEAATFVAAIQNRQGLQIACLEEIAFSRGWINAAQMEKNIAAMGHSSYAAYLRGLLA